MNQHLNIGASYPHGGLVQTKRTRDKLVETTDQLVLDVEKILDVELTEDLRGKLAQVLYSATAWTASDVLAQALADGYKPGPDTTEVGYTASPK